MLNHNSLGRVFIGAILMLCAFVSNAQESSFLDLQQKTGQKVKPHFSFDLISQIH